VKLLHLVIPTQIVQTRLDLSIAGVKLDTMGMVLSVQVSDRLVVLKFINFLGYSLVVKINL
jgi:hypothetical protein